MDLWVSLVIFVLFGIVIGSERQLSRGVAAKLGWRAGGHHKAGGSRWRDPGAGSCTLARCRPVAGRLA